MTPIFILDGGLGTTLESNYNKRFSSAETPLWSSDLLISDPSTLQECQQSFVDAGADIIETATYQISDKGFQDSRSAAFPGGVDKAHIPPFLQRAVEIAEKATTAKGGKVALSLGPYGACMVPSQEYSGDYGGISENELGQWHLERLQLFLQIKNLAKRVDFIALETIPKALEIKITRRILTSLEEFRSVPYWVSCLYPGDEHTLPSGDTAAEAVRTILTPEYGRAPWGIGINCTKVHRLVSLVEIYASAVEDLVEQKVVREWPALILYPDGTNGEIYNTTTQIWEKPEAVDSGSPPEPWEVQLAGIVRSEQARGKWRAVVVGGCCCADPLSIGRLHKLLRP